MIKNADEFIRLRSSEDPEEYRRAAWEEAPIEVWREIIEKYPDYKEWVAHNKKIPEELIRELARDSDERVRDTIAYKRITPPDVLIKLAKDKDETVRSRVVNNAKAPIEALKILADDKMQFICEVAKEKLSILSTKDIKDDKK